MIIKWPLNGLVHDACDVNLMSQTQVREMDDEDDDNGDEPTLGVIFRVLKTSKVNRMTTSNGVYGSKP